MEWQFSCIYFELVYLPVFHFSIVPFAIVWQQTKFRISHLIRIQWIWNRKSMKLYYCHFGLSEKSMKFHFLYTLAAKLLKTLVCLCFRTRMRMETILFETKLVTAMWCQYHWILRKILVQITPYSRLLLYDWDLWKSIQPFLLYSPSTCAFLKSLQIYHKWTITRSQQNNGFVLVCFFRPAQGTIYDNHHQPCADFVDCVPFEPEENVNGCLWAWKCRRLP